MGLNSRTRSAKGRDSTASVRVRRPNQVAGASALAAVARRFARHAYAPYSGFAVGAALESASGAIIGGCNVENAAYPLGVCAERAALLEWRAAGEDPIIRVVIHTETDAPTTPCGLCREALLRWAPDAELHLSSRQGLLGPYRPGDWLPAGRREDA